MAAPCRRVWYRTGSAPSRSGCGHAAVRPSPAATRRSAATGNRGTSPTCHRSHPVHSIDQLSSSRSGRAITTPSRCPQSRATTSSPTTRHMSAHMRGWTAVATDGHGRCDSRRAPTLSTSAGRCRVASIRATRCTLIRHRVRAGKRPRSRSPAVPRAGTSIPALRAHTRTWLAVGLAAIVRPDPALGAMAFTGPA